MADIKLSDEESSDLNLALRENIHGIYCRQCRKCVSQCIKSLDIPTAMRSYMYAYGYKNLAHARQTISYSQITADDCKNCENCPVVCPMGFDVKEKIADISRLTDVPEDLLI